MSETPQSAMGESQGKVAPQQPDILVPWSEIEATCKRIMKESNDLAADSADYRIGQWSGADKVLFALDCVAERIRLQSARSQSAPKFPTEMERIYAPLDRYDDPLFVAVDGVENKRQSVASSIAPMGDCATCKGDPEVCASVPGLRHCEKAVRQDETPRTNEIVGRYPGAGVNFDALAVHSRQLERELNYMQIAYAALTNTRSAIAPMNDTARLNYLIDRLLSSELAGAIKCDAVYGMDREARLTRTREEIDKQLRATDRTADQRDISPREKNLGFHCRSPHRLCSVQCDDCAKEQE